MVANFPGVLINAINLIVLARYSSTRHRAVVIIATSLAVLFCISVVFFGLFINTPMESATQITGALMACASSLFFLSPLRAVASAVSRLDASAVPGALPYVQLVQAGNWIVVGALYPDLFFIGVNAAGAAIALLQIVCLKYIQARRKALGMEGAGAADSAAPEGKEGKPPAVEEVPVGKEPAEAAPSGVAGSLPPAEGASEAV